MWVAKVDGNRNRPWSKLLDTVLAIFVDLGRDMGLILRLGDMEKPRFGCLWMKMAFAFVRPRLNGGAITGDDWLVRLGVFNTLGEILLNELVASVLPIKL